MPVIRHITAREILDSRGRPTVEATCVLDDVRGVASVPSGASTGTAEACELRDGGTRYGGLGCRHAVKNVRIEIADHLRGVSLERQEDLDSALIALDGTPNKSRLGANAVLAVSIAFARAHAESKQIPLFAHFAEMVGHTPRELPRMTINLFSGGKHAGGQMPIQDILLVPVSAGSIDDGLAMVHVVYQAAIDLTKTRYHARPLRADEGGLAPEFPNVETALADTVQCIRAAGLTPGKDVAIALDVASSHFHDQGRYHLGGETLGSRGMIDRLRRWVEEFPIVSVEDGLAEDDWDHWPQLKSTLAGRALVLGDDFLCTNPDRIRRAVGARAADALLLKVNQIGTLTQAAESLRLAKAAGWRVTVSARSGETEDSWLADLAVGWGGDQIKVGSITQSERLAKYNRLLEIEEDHLGASVVGWPNEL